MKRIVVAVAIFASVSCWAQDAKRQTLSAPGGRFVLGQIGDDASSQYLLDSQTGRVWEVINITNEQGQSIATGLKPLRFYTPSGNSWGTEPPPVSSTK